MSASRSGRGRCWASSAPTGKTTTVESIVGLVAPDEGAIEDLRHRRPRPAPRRPRARIGVVLQSTGLQDKITPREALQRRCSRGCTRRASDGHALIERFGLTEKADAPFDTLSGGQKQRLALALAFIGAPELVFLDEPTAKGSTRISGATCTIMSAPCAVPGCAAVLLTTHDMTEAEQLCDRIVMLDHGRIVAQGRPDALLGGQQGLIQVRLRTSAAPEGGWPAGLPRAGALTAEDGGVSFATVDLHRAMTEIIAFLDLRGIAITAMRAGQPTLEDVLLKLTARA